MYLNNRMGIMMMLTKAWIMSFYRNFFPLSLSLALCVLSVYYCHISLFCVAIYCVCSPLKAKY